MATRAEKEARINELVASGMSYTQAIQISDQELGEGYSHGEHVGASSGYIPEKYKKQYPVEKYHKDREVQESEFPISKNMKYYMDEDDVDLINSFINKFKGKEREDIIAKIKGFRSKEEFDKLSTLVAKEKYKKGMSGFFREVNDPKSYFRNKKEEFLSKFRKAEEPEREPEGDFLALGESFTPTTTKEKTFGKPWTEEGVSKKASEIGRGATYIKDTMMEGLSDFGAFAAGSVLLANPFREKYPSEQLEHYRKKSEKEEKKEKQRLYKKAEEEKKMEWQHKYQLAKIKASQPMFGFGTQKPKKRVSFDRQVERKLARQATIGGGSAFSLGGSMSGGFMNMSIPTVQGKFTLGNGLVSQRKQISAPKKQQRQVVHQDAVSALGLGGFVGSPQRQISSPKKQQFKNVPKRQNENGLVDMGMFNAAENPLGGMSLNTKKKQKKQSDPLGLSGFY